MKRSAGILLHLSSLPSPYGIGTLGKAAYEFTDFLKAAGQTYWQMLPIGPTGYGDSPYQSSASFGGNPYFVDPDILEQEGLLTREELCLFQWGGDPQRVDYGLLYQNRGVLLRRAYDRWDGREEAEYRSFLEENGLWLVDYAEFAALKERFGGLSWLEWPETYRSPETIPEKVRESLEEEVNYHCFVQFLFFRQWNALRRYANGQGVYLIGDLPFYSALDSADVWANPEQFQLDERRNPTAVAGVPPDCFSKNGQLWGNPLYDWDFMRQDGYSWWIRRMRRGAALFDLVRLDHFRGLESYWAVPFGETDGSAGRWEKGPAMELIRRFREEVPEADNVVADFKAKTEELFNGINGQTQDDIEQTVWAYLQSEIDEYGIDVELVDVVVSGSRCRGLEKAGSDLDVVVEYKGREHEDDLFNVFNEDGLMIGGIKVDINPITEGKTGTLATYLPGVESYLAEKQAMQKASAVEATPEKTVTLTVAECGEFHSLGEFHENIASVEEAIAVWKSIPPERMNGIPSIGINIHTEGTERYEDVEIDILSGKGIDLEVLDYVPDIIRKRLRSWQS